jgi:hypothetical protein
VIHLSFPVAAGQSWHVCIPPMNGLCTGACRCWVHAIFLFWCKSCAWPSSVVIRNQRGGGALRCNLVLC